MNEKKDIDIIIVYPYRFREFDRLRFEIECLKKKANVIVYELIDAIHPYFSPAYHERDNGKDIERFSSVSDWRTTYESKVALSKQKPYVINFIPSTNIKDTFVNYIVSNSNVYIIEYKNPGIPNHILEMNSFFALFAKVRYVIRNTTLPQFRYIFMTKLMQIFSKFFCRKSDFILAADHKHTLENNNQIISANSFDYTLYLNYKDTFCKSDLYKDNIVFLDGGGPLFSTDSLLTKGKYLLTVEKWYPAIRKYFDRLEELTSLQVVIAAHPKHKFNSETNKIFGNRRIIHGKTQEVIYNSKMVITRGSTATSFAIMYNKPIIMIYSDEIRQDNRQYKSVRFWSEELSCPFVNIDHPVFPNKYKIFPKINKKSYMEYKLKHLTSRIDNKTNCEIIIDEIINNKNTFSRIG